MAAETEQGAPAAGAADNRLGEAYRLHLVEDIRNGTFWLSSARVNLTFNGHPSTDAAAKLSCSIEGSEGASHKMPDNLEGGYVMNVLTLTPDTACQFRIRCKVMENDGSGAIKVGPKGRIVTLVNAGLNVLRLKRWFPPRMSLPMRAKSCTFRPDQAIAGLYGRSP